MRLIDSQPLPGDLVIRRQAAGSGLRTHETFCITRWPSTDGIVGGPYQSYGYAFVQACERVARKSIRVWRDHAAPGQPEALEQVV